MLDVAAGGTLAVGVGTGGERAVTSVVVKGGGVEAFPVSYVEWNVSLRTRI